MDELTGWWETSSDYICSHLVHLIYDPERTSAYRENNWIELTQNELALLILRHGIASQELETQIVLRGD